jgi:hypothetical protein
MTPRDIRFEFLVPQVGMTRKRLPSTLDGVTTY